jgi:hypothetical protein
MRYLLFSRKNAKPKARWYGEEPYILFATPQQFSKMDSFFFIPL